MSDVPEVGDGQFLLLTGLFQAELGRRPSFLNIIENKKEKEKKRKKE